MGCSSRAAGCASHVMQQAHNRMGRPPSERTKLRSCCHPRGIDSRSRPCSWGRCWSSSRASQSWAGRSGRRARWGSRCNPGRSQGLHGRAELRGVELGGGRGDEQGGHFQAVWLRARPCTRRGTQFCVGCENAGNERRVAGQGQHPGLAAALQPCHAGSSELGHWQQLLRRRQGRLVGVSALWLTVPWSTCSPSNA